MTTRPSLCMLPWTGFSNNPTGQAQPCCIFKDVIKDEDGKPMYVQEYSVRDIFTSKYMQDLRTQFRNGEKPIACSTCWEDEDNGFRSKRLIHLESMSDYVDVDVDSHVSYPVEYQMIINNSCNLKCRSCTPSHSTLWQAEHKALNKPEYVMPHKQAGDKLGKLWTDRADWYKDLRRLEVVGGEPMYIKQWHYIFQELIDADLAKNIVVDMSTNCTLFYSYLMNNIIPKFKRIGVGLSVDGIGKTYEYMRYPGVWETTYGNMKKYHELMEQHNTKHCALTVQVSFTLSWPNALDLPRMHELVKTEFPNFKIWNNIVHSPDWLSIKAAPEELKELIIANWAKYDWGIYQEDINGIIAFMLSSKTDPNRFIRDYANNDNIDDHRNQTLFDAVPEYADILNKYHVIKIKQVNE